MHTHCTCMHSHTYMYVDMHAYPPPHHPPSPHTHYYIAAQFSITKSFPTWTPASNVGWLVCPHIVGGQLPVWYIVTWTHTDTHTHKHMYKHVPWRTTVTKSCGGVLEMQRILSYSRFSLLRLEEARICSTACYTYCQESCLLNWNLPIPVTAFWFWYSLPT